MISQLNKLAGNLLKIEGDIREANIIAIGSASDKYSIKFRDGSVATNVIGSIGMTIGSSVLVRKGKGRISNFTILSKSYGTLGAIKTISV